MGLSGFSTSENYTHSMLSLENHSRIEPWLFFICFKRTRILTTLCICYIQYALPCGSYENYKCMSFFLLTLQFFSTGLKALDESPLSFVGNKSKKTTTVSVKIVLFWNEWFLVTKYKTSEGSVYTAQLSGQGVECNPLTETGRLWILDVMISLRLSWPNDHNRNVHKMSSNLTWPRWLSSTRWLSEPWKKNRTNELRRRTSFSFLMKG